MKSINKNLELAIGAALSGGKKTLKFYKSDFEVLVKDDHSPLTLADLEANQAITELLLDSGIPILSEESKVLSYTERKEWGQLWLVDPLDGTKEFINKSAEYTINIALVKNNRPVLGVVYAPALNVIYFGSEKSGSFRCQVKHSYGVSDVIRHAELLQSGKLHKKLRVVASRSHLSPETEKFIMNLEKKTGEVVLKSYGSSLKLCMVADGSADIYPRLGPTMEWDTAASHAVAVFAGCEIINAETGKALTYNKKDLLNPWFIVYNEKLSGMVKKLVR